MSRFQISLIALVAAVLGTVPQTASSREIPDPEIRIGVLAKRGPDRCLKKWSPTAKFLTNTIPDYTFRIVPLDFEQVIPATRLQDIDFILANSAFYVQLEAEFRIRRIVTLKNQLAGQAYTTFGGVVFCRADRTDITGLEDLRQKRFAAVENSSFGGWHAAWRELKATGIDPDRDFSDLKFLGTHDAVVYAVVYGTADAGTVRTDTLERMAIDGQIDLKEIKIIPATDEAVSDFPFRLSTRLYPEWPLAALNHVGDDLVEEVAAALLAMPPESPAASASRSLGWTIPLNYTPVHDCARELGIGIYAQDTPIKFSTFFRAHWPWFAGSLVLFLGILVVLAAFAHNNRVLLEVRGDLRKELVERKNAQDALQKSENLYRGLMERAADAIFLLDLDGYFTEANDAVTRNTGFEVNEVIGRHFRSSFETADRNLAKTAFNSCAQGEAVEFDCRIRRKNAGPAWFSISIQPIVSPTGNVIGIQGISHNIQERKRFEHRKHRESEIVLRTILESTADGIIAIDSHDKVMHANTRFINMWGIPQSLFRAADATQLYDFMTDQLAEPEAFLACVRNNTANQSEHHGTVFFDDGRVFERFSCPLVFEDTIEGRVCSYRDITDRTRGERERALLLSAIEQAGEAIVITDSGGTIEYVNPAFETVTGFSKDEAIGRDSRILNSHHHDSTFFSELWAAISSGSTWRGRIVNRRKDGSEFTEDVIISPIRHDDGHIAHFIAVKRDVSHEIELEGQLRQAQKMEAVGQLAAGVAHDFNNLLQVIDGHVDLLLMTLDPNDPAREDMETVRDATDRAANLTRQLLAFSRQQWIQPIDLDLNRLITDLMKLLRRVIGADIDLRVLQDDDLGLIHADPGQIEQVLVNLCINARDAMPEGGTLIIETENLLCPGVGIPDGLVELKPGPYACLMVNDSGNGIDSGTIDHIFEPFFTTKEVGHGTGLGLATVYGIVQQHQGMITVDSEPGTGTTFKVFLPVVQPEDNEDNSITDGRDESIEGDEMILIAEDEERIRDLTRRVLEQHGFRVLGASDGEEALRLFNEHFEEIQLALIDIIMPKMSGHAVVAGLQEKNPGLPILLTTGFSPTSSSSDFTPAENLHLLRKPYHSHELLKKIREILDNQTPEPIIPMIRIRYRNDSHACPARGLNPRYGVLEDQTRPGFDTHFPSRSQKNCRMRLAVFVIEGRTPHRKLIEEPQSFQGPVDHF